MRKLLTRTKQLIRQGLIARTSAIGAWRSAAIIKRK